MERRSFLRTLLRMGNQDEAAGNSSWKRLLLVVASGILLLGVAVLIRGHSDNYLRLSGLTLIFMSMGCYVVVLTSRIATRNYRTWPIVIGGSLAFLFFLLGFVFFFLGFQY